MGNFPDVCRPAVTYQRTDHPDTKELAMSHHPRTPRTLARRATILVAVLLAATVGLQLKARAEEPCDPDHVTPLCADLESGYAPSGVLVGVSRRPGGILVGGWAQDQDVPAGPIPVRITVNGQTAGTVTASTIRSDGTLGFNAFVPTNATGLVTVRAWAADDVGTLEADLGSKQITMSSAPIGYLDDVQSGAWSVWVRGWAIDPDVAAPISVHVYQDGTFVTAATADSTRNDVSAAYPGYGADHGFDITVPHAANGQHTICVYAINTGAGTGNNPLLGCQSYTEVHSPPAAPSQLRLDTYQWVADGPYHGVLVFMDNSTDETNFRVYIQGGAYTSATDIGSVQGDSNRGLKLISIPAELVPLTQYCFWVYAYTAYNNSMTYGCLTTPRLPPLMPQNVAAPGKTETSITLQWDDRATDEDAFDVKYWKQGSLSRAYHGEHAPVPAHPGTGKTTFTLTGLQPATNYCIQVSSAYQELRSWPSNAVCETTATPSPPAAPTNVKVTAASQTSLDVVWTDNATNETGYRVERQDNGTWVTRTTKGAGATMYTDTGLTAGTSYCYRVVAFNAGGATPSATACGTTSTPQGVKTAKVWNCESSKRSGSLYMLDYTAGGTWTKVAPLPTSWTTNGCGIPVTPTQPAASVDLPDGHLVMLSAVIVDDYLCTKEDPTTTKCRAWDSRLLDGDAAGSTELFMFP
jgi:hypothetical protein